MNRFNHSLPGEVLAIATLGTFDDEETRLQRRE